MAASREWYDHAHRTVWRTLRICMRWWCSGVFAIPHTLGFPDRKRRREHWGTHHQDFARHMSVAKYEAMADRFLTRPLRPTMLPCTRPKGWMLRYDQGTGEFGVLSSDGMIRSYFKPIPCCWMPPAFVDKRWCHEYPDNYSYFVAECKK